MRLKLMYSLMLIPFLGIAQWNQNGDNTSTGNLRIGSSTNDNISELTILGPNQPLYSGSARDITFDFAAAGKSIIRSYRGGSWDTFIQFLTMPYTGGEPGVRMHIAGNGRVGIGTTNPRDNLEIMGGNGGVLRLASSNTNVQKGDNAGVIHFYKEDASFSSGIVSFIKSKSSNLGGHYSLDFGTGAVSDVNNPLETKMSIRYDGNVGIGTTNPDEKLTVKGKIHTQEVRVDLNGAVAPDYVFEKDYDLKSLEEVKKYISNTGHLPNIPSAEEMDENGLNLKEMNLKLLEKIEELTLYLIEEHTSNTELRKRIQILESK